MREGSSGSPRPDGPGRYGDDYYLGHTALHTPLSMREVFTHYEVLLRRAGWTATDSVRAERSWTTAFHMNDADGNPWVASLVMWSPPGMQVIDLVLVMRRSP